MVRKRSSTDFGPCLSSSTICASRSRRCRTSSWSLARRAVTPGPWPGQMTAGSYRMNFSIVWRNNAISPSPGLITDVPVPMTLSPANSALRSRTKTARLPYVCPGAHVRKPGRLRPRTERAVRRRQRHGHGHVRDQPRRRRDRVVPPDDGEVHAVRPRRHLPWPGTGGHGSSGQAPGARSAPAGAGSANCGAAETGAEIRGRSLPHHLPGPRRAARPPGPQSDPEPPGEARERGPRVGERREVHMSAPQLTFGVAAAGDARHLSEFAQRAEALGFERVTMGEHVMDGNPPRPTHLALPMAAAAAGSTRRLRGMTRIVIAPPYHPP